MIHNLSSHGNNPLSRWTHATRRMLQNRSRILLAALCTSACIAASLTSPRAAEKAHIIAMGGQHLSDAAQFKSMMDDVFRTYSRSFSYPANYVYYRDDNQFEKALRAGSPDVFFHIKYEFFWKHLQGGGYAPFLTYSAFGKRATSKCLYVRKNSPVKDLKSLAHAKAAALGDSWDYFLLWRLVGKAPEDFFGSLRAAPDSVSLVYQLNMGGADAAFVDEYHIEMMRRSNPGPIRNIRAAGCTPSFPRPPIFRSRKPAAAGFVKSFGTTFLHIHDDPIFKKYKPIIRSFKFRFYEVTPADYSSVVAVFREAVAKGRDKAYRRWIKTALPKEK